MRSSARTPGADLFRTIPLIISEVPSVFPRMCHSCSDPSVKHQARRQIGKLTGDDSTPHTRSILRMMRDDLLPFLPKDIH